MNKIGKQVILSILAIAIIYAVKIANTPVSNTLMEKVNWTLTNNVNLQDLYKEYDSVIDKIINNNIISGFIKKDMKSTDDSDNLDASQSQDSDSQYSIDEVLDFASDDASQGDDPNNSDIISDEKKLPKTDEESDIINGIKSKFTFTCPVYGALGSPFGSRINPISKKKEFHKGVDIKANSSTPIKSALDGTVFAAEYEKSYGNYIILNHSDGITTLYAHCSKLLVKNGQKVKKGQIIALVGSTGNSTGPHLHFEVHKDGKLLDPLSFIKLK